MIMSFPDFGIYPEELRKANRLIISIAKNYNLTENDLDDADDIAKDIINLKLREEKYPLDKLTNTINLCRIKEAIQKLLKKITYQSLTSISTLIVPISGLHIKINQSKLNSKHCTLAKLLGYFYLSLSLPKRCLIIFGSTLFGITAPLGTVLLLVELWNVLDKKEKK